MRVICLRYVFKNLWENLQKSMSEIYYMSPKIRETEKFSHGFLEISDSDYIIVSRIFGDIWKINVSKNPWELYFSPTDFMDFTDFWRYTPKFLGIFWLLFGKYPDFWIVLMTKSQKTSTLDMTGTLKHISF